MSLELVDITVTVPDGLQTRTLLDGISLTVDAGEVVALTGASGSGKSTLIAVAALLLTPDRGRVRIGGVDPGAKQASRTRLRHSDIGIVYQSANLLPALTALEQVELVAHIGGNLNRDSRRRAEQLLVEVGLESRKNARPGELSGGERQRVGIARALMNRPTVLLADEPTAALDAERGRAVMGLLRDQAVQHGAAALVVTHLPEQLTAGRQLDLADAEIHETLVADDHRASAG